MVFEPLIHDFTGGPARSQLCLEPALENLIQINIMLRKNKIKYNLKTQLFFIPFAYKT